MALAVLLAACTSSPTSAPGITSTNPSPSVEASTPTASSAETVSTATTSPASSSGTKQPGSEKPSSTAPSAADPTAPPAGWTDEEVTFVSDGITVHGTFRHPTAATDAMPAALLIAGSGAVDRNGNGAQAPQLGTLAAVAGWLAQDGMASLRYDKLGTGATPAGSYAQHPAGIGIGVFEHEAAAALTFLATRPGVDARRLTVIGHSEGALFALLAAQPGRKPVVSAVALLEPLSRRYLDLLDEQLSAQITAATHAGSLSSADAAALRAAVTATIRQIRSAGTVPANLPTTLRSLFNATTARFLQEADRLDPAALAARLPTGLPVLISCSDADIQVSCDDVAHLVAGLTRAKAATTEARLTGVDHILKQDDSKGAEHYGDALGFSTQLAAALATFTGR